MDRNQRSRISRRTLLGTAGAAGAAAALSTNRRFDARATRQDEEPVQGGTLTYGNSKPSQPIINPLNTVGTGQNVLIEAMFLRLVYGREWGDGINPQAEGPIELAVAETMTEIEPDRVWDFTIRPNVLWHDGQPVTADDVIFGIWLSLNKNSGATSETPVVAIVGGERLKNEGAAPGDVMVEGATKTNDNTVRIELEEPIPNYWVNWSVGYWPMPSHIYRDMPFEDLFTGPTATMPVGNGPFKALNYVDGQYMEMEANPDFYAGRPYLDKYIVRFGDPDTLAAALEAQEIDGAGVSAGPVYDRLSQVEHLVGNAVPRDHPDGLVVNFERIPEAADLHRAIQHALDAETINQQLYSGTLRPSNNLFAHVVGMEENPAGFETRAYDPDKARAILEEIGWDTNRELSWMMWAPPAALQDAIQAMLADVGIKTAYQVIDAATVIDELYRNANYDIVLANFGAAQSMEDNWKYIKCGWGYDEGGFNYARFCNADIDSQWQAALDTPDLAERKGIFDEINLALNATPPQATTWRQSITYMWNQRVRGAYPYQYRLPVRQVFEKVWIAE